MVQQEIGISPGLIDNPFEIGFISAGSFVIGSLPAIIPFFVLKSIQEALSFSAVLVLFFLFVLGVLKSKVTKVHWLKSGLETLFIGAISCSAGFFLGRLANSYFN